MLKKILKHFSLGALIVGSLVVNPLMANDCTDLIKQKKVYDAVDICTKMAKQGNVPAQFALGTLYFQGQGVMADKKLGFKWVKRAAEGGLPVAQYNVGIMLANGMGVEANLEKAYTWIYIADKYGYQEAKGPMQEMAKELSKKEKQRAEKAAEQLLDKNQEVKEKNSL